jgi:hypothetical protein
MAKKMICVKDCFVYNKRFKQGDEFPEKWIQEGYLPNMYFLPEGDAKAAIEASKFNRPVQCAGDDPRSTKELKTELMKHMKSFPEKWGRKEIWLELNKHENAKGKTA